MIALALLAPVLPRTRRKRTRCPQRSGAAPQRRICSGRTSSDETSLPEWSWVLVYRFLRLHGGDYLGGRGDAPRHAEQYAGSSRRRYHHGCRRPPPLLPIAAPGDWVRRGLWRGGCSDHRRNRPCRCAARHSPAAIARSWHSGPCGHMDAARMFNAPTWWIIARHLLPNTLAPMLVVGSTYAANAILAEAALSLLGLGSPRQRRPGETSSATDGSTSRTRGGSRRVRDWPSFSPRSACTYWPTACATPWTRGRRVDHVGRWRRRRPIAARPAGALPHE